MDKIRDWVQKRIKLDKDYYRARMELYKDKPQDLHSLSCVLGEHLKNPGSRGTALSIIEAFDTELIELLFEDLAELAFYGVSEVQLCRTLLAELSKEKFLARIKPVEEKILSEGTDWEYRRGAELYDFLGYEELLQNLLAKAYVDENPDIKEIAEDFDFKPASS